MQYAYRFDSVKINRSTKMVGIPIMLIIATIRLFLPGGIMVRINIRTIANTKVTPSGIMNGPSACHISPDSIAPESFNSNCPLPTDDF